MVKILDYNTNNIRKICFVCTANMSRSLMAESIFKKFSTKIECISCGTHAISGMSITKKSKSVLEEKGYTCDNLQSKSYSDVDLDDTLIICMTQSHKEFMKSKLPDYDIYLITEIGSGRPYDIDDPVRDNLDKHRITFELIKSEINLFINRLDTTI